MKTRMRGPVPGKVCQSDGSGGEAGGVVEEEAVGVAVTAIFGA